MRSLFLKLKKFIRPLCLVIFKILLPKQFLISRYGLVAVGERNRLIRYPKWVTIDWVGTPDYLLDLDHQNYNLPFKSDSCQCIYSSHNLEHLSFNGACKFFEESSRILRDGGELLLDVPCSKKAYIMLGKAINNPNDIYLNQYLRHIHIAQHSLEISYDTCPSNKQVPSSWLLHPINRIIPIIACYMDGVHDVHLPVIHNPQSIREIYMNSNMNEFFEYLFSKLPKGRRYSGGHCEAWYPEKIIPLLHKYSFHASIRLHGESHILSHTNVPDRGFFTRDIISFKVSALKHSC